MLGIVLNLLLADLFGLFLISILGSYILMVYFQVDPTLLTSPIEFLLNGLQSLRTVELPVLSLKGSLVKVVLLIAILVKILSDFTGDRDKMNT